MRFPLRRRFTLHRPDRRQVTEDLTAGTVLGLVSVPDGLAAGLLAGLNPIAGLHGYLVGTAAGALATSAVFMSVQATGAMAVVISDIPEVRGRPDSGVALATLGVLTGAVMLLLGVLRLGSMVRFVPNAVLTGFVNAVAVNIVLGQLADFTGFRSEAANRVVRLVDTVANLGSWQWLTVATGVLTLVLVLWLERTRLGALGLVVGVVGSSAAVALLGWTQVPLVRDIADIPQSLPTPQLPSLSFVAPLLVPAVALAFVGLVQGAAISQSVPNPDGTYPDSSGDFRGQGIANIASALLRGMPVGGSMSGTALVMAAGARSRLANLTAAVVMAIVILLLADVAGYIAMPSLAALLMLVGVRTLSPDKVLMVWRTGATQATVMGTTFVLTMLIPLQYAVLAGIAISVVLHVGNQSTKVTVTRWVFEPGSPHPVETAPPAALPAGEVVVLTAYGSLFFASSAVAEAQLPTVTPDSRGAVVVLRLRGKEDLGSTFLTALLRYHEALAAVGSHLLVAGVGEQVLGQMTRTGALDRIGAQNVFPATPRVGESLVQARALAETLRA